MQLSLPFLAIASSFSLFFSQIKSFISRFSTLFLETHNLESDLHQWLFFYCKDNYKTLPMGGRNYESTKVYFNKLDRHGFVGYERNAKFCVFRKSWSFILFSIDTTQTKGEPPRTAQKVYFIRGTFDIEDLIIKSIERRNNELWQTTNSRFYIRKYFGVRGKKTDSNYPEEGQKVSSIPDWTTARLLGYSQEDIGELKKQKPFDPFYFDAQISHAIDLINFWYKSKKWYLEKQIPWRYGCLFYGGPGTGKSSCAKAIAMSLDLPINIFDLTTMDNQEFTRHWSNAINNAPVMILFEDFDRLFEQKDFALTTDCLLNAISGVENSDGVLLCITANDVTKLDSAFGIPKNGQSTRPGRVDVAVEFKALSEEGRLYVARRLLDNGNIDRVVKEGNGDTGAQFVQRCSEIALREYWSAKDTKKEGH